MFEWEEVNVPKEVEDNILECCRLHFNWAAETLFAD